MVEYDPKSATPMTFAELKAQLEDLTPEQLAAPVIWCGDEQGGVVRSLWIAQEDWVDNDGDCEPRSVVMVSGGDACNAVVIIPKGTPQLLVD